MRTCALAGCTSSCRNSVANPLVAIHMFFASTVREPIVRTGNVPFCKMSLTGALFSIKTPFEAAFSSNAVIILPVSSCPSNLLKIAFGATFSNPKGVSTTENTLALKIGKSNSLIASKFLAHLSKTTLSVSGKSSYPPS